MTIAQSSSTWPLVGGTLYPPCWLRWETERTGWLAVWLVSAAEHLLTRPHRLDSNKEKIIQQRFSTIIQILEMKDPPPLSQLLPLQALNTWIWSLLEKKSFFQPWSLARSSKSSVTVVAEPNRDFHSSSSLHVWNDRLDRKVHWTHSFNDENTRADTRIALQLTGSCIQTAGLHSAVSHIKYANVRKNHQIRRPFFKSLLSCFLTCENLGQLSAFGGNHSRVGWCLSIQI